MSVIDSRLEPIPHPPEKPLVGNVFDLSSDTQVQDLMRIAADYDGIFYLQLGGHRNIIVSDYDLVQELSDESRFDKRVWAPLKNVRDFAGDGLFTAHTFEPNWKKAHNVLLPNFSMAAMQRYHPMMIDIARQMIDKWSRLNPGESVSVSDEMTRLTLDTIGLCGFGYRFNSFYRERPHPFINSMSLALGVAMDRTNRPGFVDRLQFAENTRFRKAIKLMNDTVDGIIQERRANPGLYADSEDLLTAMMVGIDRETGERLDDLNIRYQIITFLIAGHETTSGLLSFTIYHLLRHPEVLQRAIDEVDAVLGPNFNNDPTYRQVTDLRYVRQVLNESLRLWPTAPMFALFPLEGETIIGGRYQISKHDGIAVLVPMLHRDTKIWGENAAEFDPEHFSAAAERERPPEAFKPFGNGQRACIGRQFAMHEATLALGMILQRFDLVGPDNYELKIKETLTLKPDGLSIRLKSRTSTAKRASSRTAAAISGPVAHASTVDGASTVDDVCPVHEVSSVPADGGQLAVLNATAAPSALTGDTVASRPKHGTKLQILYGSNMGTAESIAGRLGDGGEQYGFDVSVDALDDAVDSLDRDGLVVIVTASYNGTPPDNAQRFASWLDPETLGSKGLAGVRFAVFGCGHHDWASTYQSVPIRFDNALQQCGAERFHERGAGDAGDDFEGDFENWRDNFWQAAATAIDVDFLSDNSQRRSFADTPYAVDILPARHPNPFVQTFRAWPMLVIENNELQSEAYGRSTRHIELALPDGLQYETGDHLGVIAKNHPSVVQRVIERFGFDEQTRIRIRPRSEGNTDLPIDDPIPVIDLLTDYVELQEPATRSQIRRLLEYTRCPPERPPLEALCGDDEESRQAYRERVLNCRMTVLDLMESSPACELPFGDFLGMLPPLRPRYYSISSSPWTASGLLSLTVSVVQAEARSGRGTFYGCCSTYLAAKKSGQSIFAFVRRNPSGFRMPDEPAKPIIMVGPGTGIAPFRGFLQERAALVQQDVSLGPALLFFGCRHPDHDDLYRRELNRFASSGIADVITAYSRQNKEKTYVQDKIVQNGRQVWDLLAAGATIYVCGDAGEMAPAVRQAFAKVYQSQTGGDEAAANEWLEQLIHEHRYLVDVWAST
jgi:cytochrome P450/NADPH-cytochrome P450 reductase